MELNDAISTNHFRNARTETRYVDVLYNLEIDGHAPYGPSRHSYLVHGVTASGLGDDVLLNQLFQRQKAWQTLPLDQRDLTKRVMTLNPNLNFVGGALFDVELNLSVKS